METTEKLRSDLLQNKINENVKIKKTYINK
jgi:hypothetical protein